MKKEEKSPQCERLAKRIAGAGVCSRREAEKLIEQGLVYVNGELITSPALNVSGEDLIVVDGQEIGDAPRPRLWGYYKPAGVVTTHKDPQDRPTLFSELPEKLPRVISIGRLDLNSEGLILLTNDSRLARHAELPSTGWARCYKVRVFGEVDERQLADLVHGITIDGIAYGRIEADLIRQQGRNAWLTITLYEGKNREIRTIMRHLDLHVNRLIRLAYGPFDLLNDQPRGLWEIPYHEFAPYFPMMNSDQKTKDSLTMSDTPMPRKKLTLKKGAPTSFSKPTEGEEASAPKAKKRPWDKEGTFKTELASNYKPRREKEADTPKPKRSWDDKKESFGKPSGFKPRREEGGDAPKRSWGDKKESFGKPSFGFKPRREEGGDAPKRSWGDKKESFGKPSFGFKPRREEGGDAPKRSWGDKKESFGKPSFGSKPRREEGGDAPKRSWGDKKESFGKPSFGSKPRREEGGDAPKRSWGDKKKSFGKPSGFKPRREEGGDAPKRSWGDKKKSFGKPSFGFKPKRDNGGDSSKPKRTWDENEIG